MTAFPHISYAADSDVGRRRTNNEDSFGAFPEAGVFCVADGMGGGDDGEIASAATVQSIARIAPAITPCAGLAYPFDSVADAVSAAVNSASKWIFTRSETKGLQSCGSTFVGLCLDPANPAVALAMHAGDSRLYLIHHGAITQITKDHSIAEMIGAKNDSEVNPMFRSVILRAVGVKEFVEIERTPFPIAEGDRIIICSDGLSRMVGDERILEISSLKEDPTAAIHALIMAANAAGGHDNITAIVVDIGPLPPPMAVGEPPNIAEALAYSADSSSQSDESTTLVTAEGESESQPSATSPQRGWNAKATALIGIFVALAIWFFCPLCPKEDAPTLPPPPNESEVIGEVALRGRAAALRDLSEVCSLELAGGNFAATLSKYGVKVGDDFIAEVALMCKAGIAEEERISAATRLTATVQSLVSDLIGKLPECGLRGDAAEFAAASPDDSKTQRACALLMLNIPDWLEGNDG